MKVNNLYAKPIMKAVFYIVLALGLVNLGVLLTRMQPFTDLTHISIAVTLFISAGLIMSRNFFIKYNSEDAVLEIERAGIFSSNTTVHSSQLGFVKTKIDNFSVENTWYGGAFTIGYSTSTGRPYTKRFPFLFASSEVIVQMSNDLGEITNTVVETSYKEAKPSKILKNSPAFS
jgi:hypothetical protein